MSMRSRLRRLEARTVPWELVCRRCEETFRIPQDHDPLLILMVHDWKLGSGHGGRYPDDALAERLDGHDLAYRATGEPVFPPASPPATLTKSGV